MESQIFTDFTKCTSSLDIMRVLKNDFFNPLSKTPGQYFGMTVHNPSIICKTNYSMLPALALLLKLIEQMFNGKNFILTLILVNCLVGGQDL